MINNRKFVKASVGSTITNKKEKYTTFVLGLGYVKHLDKCGNTHLTTKTKVSTARQK